MLKNITLEDALQSFATAYKATQTYKVQVSKRLKKLGATLTETVQDVFDLGGNAKDCKEVLGSEGVEFNSDTIDSYFARLTPADKKQNTGKTANPAAEKGRKAMAETQGGESATSGTIAVDAACAFAGPFIALAITTSDKDGNPCTAKANASDEDKCQANINLAIAMQKGLRAASTAAAKLVTARQAEAKVLGRAKVEAAKVEANAKTDKATASKATGRRKGKAKAKKVDASTVTA
jgi:hypothetical protein|tara:strand:+ start:97 stop:804 length:708 start_codon:yes stop_codon:yes gene_type:complete